MYVFFVWNVSASLNCPKFDLIYESASRIMFFLDYCPAKDYTLVVPRLLFYHTSVVILFRSSPKRTFLQGLQPACRAVVPFHWCWLVCLCHVIKTTKMADTLEKALTFQTETNILHHYTGILLLKLLWQNQNYQLVLCGSRDWSRGIWVNPRDMPWYDITCHDIT